MVTRADWNNKQLPDGQQSRSTWRWKPESRKQPPVNEEVCQNIQINRIFDDLKRHWNFLTVWNLKISE